MDAHGQLDEAGEGQEEKDGGERHVVGKVDIVALGALELDHTVAGSVQALAVPWKIVQKAQVTHDPSWHHWNQRIIMASRDTSNMTK